MKTITPDFRARVFAIYQPCLATYVSHGCNGTYAITGVSVAEGMAQFEWDDDSDWWNISESSQLVLTPLPEITSEHAKNLLATVGHDSLNDGNVLKCDLVDGKIEIDFERHSYCIRCESHQSDYLRSEGYAIPYMGVDLFESGIAIKNVNA